MSELHDLMVDHLKKQFGALVDWEEGADFDVEAAIYWFASDYHEGQWSQLYEVLSESEFSPGPTHRSVKNEGEQAEMFYDELVATFAPKAKKTMKLKDAKRILKEIGMSISKKDGEYRVNYKGGKESTAYYTDGLDDAVSTGIAMSKETHAV